MKPEDIIQFINEEILGVLLMALIIVIGVYLTIRTRFVQVRFLGKALKYTVKNEDDGVGEVTSFGALCTALSATIGTGNIVGVATAICAGGPGALLWMLIAAFFGMATKYTEGVLAIKYRRETRPGHFLGGPFYYIDLPFSARWRASWGSVRSPRSTVSHPRQPRCLIRRKARSLSASAARALHGQR